jgi:diketogulonate reductase-like aldo/keto reductase
MILTPPAFIYGTAWKQEATAPLVAEALRAGFRAIDTANQKKHYREDFAGEALEDLGAYGLTRADLFFQSKYTYVEGQDDRLPYDPNTAYADQVGQSFASSLRHFHTDYLDSYLLHGPRSARGMTRGDWEVWGAMEALREAGKTRAIGVSNVGLSHVEELCRKARFKPEFVQNRCYAVRGWDQDVREFCLKHGIVYQGFSLLTANPQVVRSPEVAAIAARLEATAEQVIFAFSKAIGILPLTGTTDPTHMREDLESLKFKLTEEDAETIFDIGWPSGL